MSQKCYICGTDLEEGESICPACGAEQEQNTAPCPFCQTPIRVGESLCPGCGKTIEWDMGDAPPADEDLTLEGPAPSDEGPPAEETAEEPLFDVAYKEDDGSVQDEAGEEPVEEVPAEGDSPADKPLFEVAFKEDDAEEAPPPEDGKPKEEDNSRMPEGEVAEPGEEPVVLEFDPTRSMTEDEVARAEEPVPEEVATGGEPETGGEATEGEPVAETATEPDTGGKTVEGESSEDATAPDAGGDLGESSEAAPELLEEEEGEPVRREAVPQAPPAAVRGREPVAPAKTQATPSKPVTEQQRAAQPAAAPRKVTLQKRPDGAPAPVIDIEGLEVDLDEYAKRREIREKVEHDLDKRGALNDYYTLGTITTTFFVFLAILALFDLAMKALNITWLDNQVFLHLVPYTGSDVTIGLIFAAAMLAVANALLHYFDKYYALMASFLPTGIMLVGLGIGGSFATVGSSIQLILIWVLFVLTFICAIIDALAVINYPSVLRDPGRDELEAYLESLESMEAVADEYERRAAELLAQEEETIRAKDQLIQEMQAEISRREQEVIAEEENLKAKEKELTEVKSELEQKTQNLLEEQESLRTREREMASRLERQYKEKAQDFLQEEEEKLKVREQEILKLQEEANVKSELYDEAQEKLKRKEEELSTLKSELEAEIRQRLQEEEKAALARAASRKDAERRVERVLFPFSAIVGQEVMKKALILNAINPEIGGVLVPGQKGTGKSVTVRALAEILPDIKVSRDCRYNCDPDDVENLCEGCAAKHKAGKLEFDTRQIKVVDLPLNITEDRLVGSIDIEKVLSAGVKAFEPGLLAEVHRGILYVDEINLLDDYIVDILLDAAASGMVNVEREGISITHPAKFIIIGSMNPEEGELRPQLLDRLALQVEITGITDISKRIEIVNHREEFTTSPVKFREKFEPPQRELRERIKRAKEILPDVSTSPEILEHIARLCVDFNVDGHRADIIIERTARANAAYEGRLDVARQDVEIAALMAFPHRMRLPPAEMEEFDLSMIKRVMDGY